MPEAARAALPYQEEIAAPGPVAEAVAGGRASRAALPEGLEEKLPRLPDFFRGQRGMGFENKGVVFSDVARDHLEIHRSRARLAVIATLLVDVVQVEPDEPGGAGRKMAFVIEETFEVFDAGVSRVVPVADRAVFVEVSEKVVETVVERQLEEAFAILHAENEPVFLHVGKKRLVGVNHPPDRARGAAPEPRHRLIPGRRGSGRIGLEHLHRVAEAKGSTAGMHHDVPRTDAGGELDRPL